MANTSERVKAVKENFIEERQRGMSFAEIAKKYHISRRHLYNILQEIADANGVKDRSSLLDVPHKQHQRSDFQTAETIDVKEIQNSFDYILEETQTIIEKINTIIGGEHE